MTFSRVKKPVSEQETVKNAQQADLFAVGSLHDQMIGVFVVSRFVLLPIWFWKSLRYQTEGNRGGGAGTREERESTEVKDWIETLSFIHLLTHPSIDQSITYSSTTQSTTDPFIH